MIELSSGVITALLISLFTALALIYCIFFGRKRKPGFPPGPRPLPLIGNLHQIGFEPHKVFMKLRKIYGPVFSIDYATTPAIVISDPRLIRKYCGEAVFSGRPKVRAFTETRGGIGRGLILSELTPWVEQRYFVLKNMRDFGYGRKTNEQMIQDDCQELIDELRTTAGKPFNTQHFFARAVMNSLWKIISGEELRQDDPKIRHIIEFMSNSMKNVAVTGVAFFFPALTRWFPELSGYNNYVNFQAEILKVVEEMTGRQKETYQPEHKRHLIDAYLEKIGETTDPESSFYGEEGIRQMNASIQDLFIAGADTTSTQLTWVFLILALHPEIQKKLQAEIDAVIGQSRIPELEDREKMPYTNCVIMEALRYGSIAPVGFFHCTTDEANIEGYTIPKGTVVTANIFGALHEPDIWGDPEVIRPERFIRPDGTAMKGHEALIPFVAGKRQCLGEVLARNELFLFTASLCQQFWFEPDPNRPRPSMAHHPAFMLTCKTHYLTVKERIKEKK